MYFLLKMWDFDLPLWLMSSWAFVLGDSVLGDFVLGAFVLHSRTTPVLCRFLR